MASSAGTSTSAVVLTFVANLILFSIFITLFLLLRLKFTRTYSPKSSYDLVPIEKRPTSLPKLPFKWAYILLKKPTSFLIQHAGLDGYLFLRYICNMACYFLIMTILWSVLLPINATDGNDNHGFDLLSISNVNIPKRYYAHAFCSWIFYGGICFIIYRELYCYNSLRLAALSSPKYATALSSRTILFQKTPDSLLDEKQFFKLFNGVKRIYVARSSRRLDSLVRKRDNLTGKLEMATNKLLKKAYKEKMKRDRKEKKTEKKLLKKSDTVTSDNSSVNPEDFLRIDHSDENLNRGTDNIGNEDQTKLNAIPDGPNFANDKISEKILEESTSQHPIDEHSKQSRVSSVRSSADISNKASDEKQRSPLLSGSQSGIGENSGINDHNEEASFKIDQSYDIESFVPYEKFPKHRSGYSPFSKKVDTIDHCLTQISILNKEIKHLQKNYKRNSPKNSIFVEFENQYYCQLALQTKVSHIPFRMSDAYTGFNQSDIIWDNLRLFWWEDIIRKAVSVASIIAVVVLWAIPVAFIGIISNINYLIEKFPWLKFVNEIPSQLRGVITGIIPTALLSILLNMLPIFIRTMGQISGCPTNQSIEAFAQMAYFCYQFINGFIVTTISSSVTSTISRLIDQPNQVLDILSDGLPKSSNFYISYMLLQGLTVTGGALFQIVGLFLYYILGGLLDNTVRKKWNRFAGLGSISWGTTFPIFTNLTCITLSYGIISPIILLVSSAAFFLTYIAYCYNLTYVFVEGPDNKGGYYPRALFQTFTGVYVGQICLLGLFLVGKGWGPIVLQIMGLAFTVFCHINLKLAYKELNRVIPIDCMKPLDGVSTTPSYTAETEYREKVLNKMDRTIEPSNALLADRDFKVTNKSNAFCRFFRPDLYYTFHFARTLLPSTYDIENEVLDNAHAYDSPSVSAKCASIWIPRDSMGFSDQIIQKLSPIITVFDDNSKFTKKGKFTYTGPPQS